MSETNSVLIILYAFLWLISLIVNLRKQNGIWGVSTIIIASYLFYAIVSCFLYFHQRKDVHLYFFPFLYLYLMLLLGMWPVIKYDKHQYKKIVHPSSFVFNIFLCFYLLVVVVRVPGIISTLPDGLRMLVLEQAGNELYNETQQSYVAADRQIANIFAIIYSFFRDIGIFLLFYYLTLPKKKKWITLVLGLSIFVTVLDSLARGQRTGPTMVALTCVMSFFLMKPFMDDKIKKSVTRIVSIGAIIVGIPFLLLTTSRFGTNSSKDAFESIEEYTGQAPINFNQYCLDAGGIRYGDRTCTEFKRLLGFNNVPIDIDDRRNKYSSLKIDDYVFYTYVGDFTLDFGPVWAVLIFIVFSSLFMRIIFTKSKDDIPFYKMIPLYFASCVCMQGGMYLFTYSHLENYSIISTFLLYLVFLFDYKSKRPLAINTKVNENNC